jgi:hypothetical protein
MVPSRRGIEIAEERRNENASLLGGLGVLHGLSCITKPLHGTNFKKEISMVLIDANSVNKPQKPIITFLWIANILRRFGWRYTNR